MYTKAKVAAVYSWTGFYIGGHVGMSAGQMNVATVVPTTEGTDSVYGGFAQILAGVHGGYNYQVNNLVFGVEGDINHKSGNGTLLSRVALPTSDWDGSIRARAGVLVTPRALVYGTGGLAFGHFSTPWHEVASPAEVCIGPCGDPQFPKLNPEPIELLGGYRTGWTVGGGIEYVLDSNWNARIDYRYTDWGSKGVLWSADEAVDLTQASSKLRETRVISGLTYKFGPESRLVERDMVAANWGGFYAGGQVGASASHINYGGPPVNGDPFFDGTCDCEFSHFTQALAGVHGGYNWVSGQFLVGVEGDLNAKFGSGFKIDDMLRPTSSWDASVRARIGFTPTARSLIYATGGWAFGNFTTPQSGAQERAGGSTTGPSEPAEEHIGGSRSGWTVGAGMEYAVERNWTTRIDYRYTDYGSKTVSSVVETFPSKLTDNRVSIGVSYLFGNGPIVAKY